MNGASTQTPCTNGGGLIDPAARFALAVATFILGGLLWLAGPTHMASGGWLLLPRSGCALGFLVRRILAPVVAATVRQE